MSDRVNLVDPLLYQSSFVNLNAGKPIKINFWQRFDSVYFTLNVCIPIILLILLGFLLKNRYISKQKKNANIYRYEPSLFS